MRLEVGEWLAEIGWVLSIVGVVSIESRGIPFSSFHSFVPCSLQPFLLPPIPSSSQNLTGVKFKCIGKTVKMLKRRDEVVCCNMV